MPQERIVRTDWALLLGDVPRQGSDSEELLRHLLLWGYEGRDREEWGGESEDDKGGGSEGDKRGKEERRGEGKKRDEKAEEEGGDRLEEKVDG